MKKRKFLYILAKKEPLAVNDQNQPIVSWNKNNTQIETCDELRIKISEYLSTPVNSKNLFGFFLNTEYKPFIEMKTKSITFGHQKTIMDVQKLN